MKKIFALFGLLLILVTSMGMMSCSKDNDPEDPQLDVTYNNMTGIWELTQWNGTSLPDGTYCYLVIERKDKKFKLYQKMNSMYAQLFTGTYTLTTDPYLGSILNGTYDYGAGDWNNKYIVTSLTTSGKLTLTVKGDESDVSLYQKCKEVPSDILKECAQATE